MESLQFFDESAFEELQSPTFTPKLKDTNSALIEVVHTPLKHDEQPVISISTVSLVSLRFQDHCNSSGAPTVYSLLWVGAGTIPTSCFYLPSICQPCTGLRQNLLQNGLPLCGSCLIPSKQKVYYPCGGMHLSLETPLINLWKPFLACVLPCSFYITNCL